MLTGHPDDSEKVDSRFHSSLRRSLFALHLDATGHQPKARAMKVSSRCGDPPFEGAVMKRAALPEFHFAQR